MGVPGGLGTAQEELALYEGVRLGSERAFRRLVAGQAGLVGRMAALYGVDAGELARWTWSTALHGLGMFTWNTSFRAWVIGILVAHGRAADHSAPPPAAPPPAPAGTLTSWAGLAWSPRWQAGGWEVVDGALAALPLAEREVVHLHDVEGWPARETYDALGLTGGEGDRLLAAGRERVRCAVAAWLGQAPGPDPDGSQTRAVVELLGLLVREGPAPPPDRALLAAFRAWRASRRISLPRRVRGALLARGFRRPPTMRPPAA